MARGSSTGQGRSTAARALFTCLALVLALLPRAAGALVVHAHEGHGLHAHFVPTSEAAERRLDRDLLHARHHAHPHCQDGHADHDPGEGELVVALPSEPLRQAAACVTAEPPSAQPLAPFFQVAACVAGAEGERAVRPRPPRPPGAAVHREGARRLIATSVALRW
ncbi:MAG: hypothetical protein JNK02_14020 [Planctomycetes bacterium]|nr:hypothetical protein [Planctomycetota bacterium]